MATLKKRPCKICKRWFEPHPRVGERQKTCGDSGCKREWHRRKCTEWNRQNREYFKGLYLEKKLKDGIKDSRSCQFSQGTPNPYLRLPRQEIQEVIGLEQLIIIEYIFHLVLRRCHAIIKAKVIENKEK
ncbi:MAG: hypothetical protein ACMUIP_11650 [bacterium]